MQKKVKVEAIAEATGGEEIVLTDFISYDKEILLDKSIQINLNNHTLTYTGTDKRSFRIEGVNAANITFAVYNGKLVVTDTTKNAKHIGISVLANGATVDLDNVEIEMSGITEIDKGEESIESVYGITVNGAYQGIEIDLNKCTIENVYIGIYFPYYCLHHRLCQRHKGYDGRPSFHRRRQNLHSGAVRSGAIRRKR